MAKNQHNAGLHYRPLNQLGLSNFNDYIENPIDSRFKFNPPPLKCGKLFGLCKADRQKEELQKTQVRCLDPFQFVASLLL